MPVSHHTARGTLTHLESVLRAVTLATNANTRASSEGTTLFSAQRPSSAHMDILTHYASSLRSRIRSLNLPSLPSESSAIFPGDLQPLPAGPASSSRCSDEAEEGNAGAGLESTVEYDGRDVRAGLRELIRDGEIVLGMRIDVSDVDIDGRREGGER